MGTDRSTPRLSASQAWRQTLQWEAELSGIAPDLLATQPAAASRASQLQLLHDEAKRCTRCVLHRQRQQAVFARGDADSPLVFVGEGPGQQEDQQGLPFVGPAGQLLDKMIVAMGLEPRQVYICNVVKCRPPQNRTPLPDEAAACAPFLEGQLAIVAPKIIVALGRCAAESFGCLVAERGWRGRWHAWRDVPVMPTYHPAFLLRSPSFKKDVWQDLQQVMAKLRAAA